MATAPLRNGIEQGSAHFKIVYKINEAEATKTVARLLVVSWIDESGNAPYRLVRLVIGHKENRVAEAECRIARRIEIVDLIVYDRRHIAVVALIEVDGKLYELTKLLASSSSKLPLRTRLA